MNRKCIHLFAVAFLVKQLEIINHRMPATKPKQIPKIRRTYFCFNRFENRIMC